ncbi:MAG TPA: hypothetical protein VGF97_15645 [Rhizomicrobium sp.]|jgi:DNA repair ATPase RecN
MANATSAQTSQTERLLGVLIERTEALREETGELKAVTRELRAIHQETRLLVQNVTDRLLRLESEPHIPDLAVRLAECERVARDYRQVKERVFAWAFRLAAAILLLGMSGGALFKLVSGL